MLGGTKLAVAVVLGAALCGCGTTAAQNSKRYTSSADKWVGHTLDELIVAIGEPVGVARLESGSRIFKYPMDSSSNKAQARTLKKDYGGKIYGGKPVAAVQACFIHFNISANDVVESWSLEGDKCD